MRKFLLLLALIALGCGGKRPDASRTPAGTPTAQNPPTTQNSTNGTNTDTGTSTSTSTGAAIKPLVDFYEWSDMGVPTGIDANESFSFYMSNDRKNLYVKTYQEMLYHRTTDDDTWTKVKLSAIPMKDADEAIIEGSDIGRILSTFSGLAIVAKDHPIMLIINGNKAEWGIFTDLHNNDAGTEAHNTIAEIDYAQGITKPLAIYRDASDNQYVTVSGDYLHSTSIFPGALVKENQMVGMVPSLPSFDVSQIYLTGKEWLATGQKIIPVNLDKAYAADADTVFVHWKGQGIFMRKKH